MCGYIGQISFREINTEKISNANDLLICRGPDMKESLYCNSKKNFNSNFDFNVATIFNRLSVIDLSEDAMQPMYSESSNTMILFNGEIYNYKELRRELESKGSRFNTNNSDTEVLLIGITNYGLSFLQKVIGQFAITFIDFNSGKVYLIRDRLGQKPLFYSQTRYGIEFSSNLKAIVSVKGQYEVDNDSLLEYLDIGVVTSPNTIFKNIFKLKPAEIIEFSFQNEKIERSSKTFWNIEDYVSEEQFNKNEFFNLFNNSVESRLVSDVPVANFLSGGIDSTSIIKSIIKSNNEINTFSVSYGDKRYDESYWFNQVASKYNTNHVTKYVNKQDIDSYIKESVEIFDEPYSDPSTLPSYLLSKLISGSYKVAISGDGGDELLGGYKRTNLALNSNKFNEKIITGLFNIYPAQFGTGNNILNKSKNFEEAYRSFFHDKKFMSLLGLENNKKKFSYIFEEESFSNYKKLALFEYRFYLSEMMMLKVDRTSMANSLEVRSPFVDHRLIEYVLSTACKNYSKNGKSLLKDYLSEDFDNEFINREKMGFVFNIEKFIYDNFQNVTQDFSELISLGVDISAVKQLNLIKSRMNAHRIWKLYFLEIYLKSLRKIS